MKLLLDENLHGQLKKELRDHSVFSVEDQGWRGLKNGELLQLMIDNSFDVFITLDRNLQYQQNLRRYSIPILVLRVTKMQKKRLADFAPQINSLLRRRLRPGPHELTLN